MQGNDENRVPKKPVTETDEDDSPDIVGPTGEDMPLAMHDQGHRTFQSATPPQAFDPRLTDGKG